MKAQKATLKGNESPKGQNEGPKPQIFEKEKSAKFKGKFAISGQILAGWPVRTAEKANMTGNHVQKAIMKEMKPQKAKKKGNEAPKGQNKKE